jgi:hypothetical protein
MAERDDSGRFVKGQTGNPNGAFRIGTEDVASTYDLTGQLGEVLIYNLDAGTMSDTDRDAIIDWLGTRWGVTT